MRRGRTLIPAGASALIVAFVPAVNPAGATTASWVKDPIPPLAASGTTIRLDAPAVEPTRIPEPTDRNAPLTPGDRLVWTTDLFRGATHVGSAPHLCIAVDDHRLLCSATAVLPQGQIQLQTVLDLATGDLAPTSVVGGSDCYRYAQGEVVITSNQDGSSEWSFEMKGTCED